MHVFLCALITFLNNVHSRLIISSHISLSATLSLYVTAR